MHKKIQYVKYVKKKNVFFTSTTILKTKDLFFLFYLVIKKKLHLNFLTQI